MKNRYKTLLATAVFISSISSSFAQQTYTKENYEAAKKQAEATYDTHIKACSSLKDNAEDVCKAKAKAQKVRSIAYGEAHYKNTPKATQNALIDIADSEYKLAKEMCDDHQGNAKDVCLKEANAKHVSAVADAKAGKKTADAIHEAVEDKTDANYKLEKEKCDALKEAAKDECEKKVKAQFNK